MYFRNQRNRTQYHSDGGSSVHHRKLGNDADDHVRASSHSHTDDLYVRSFAEDEPKQEINKN